MVRERFTLICFGLATSIFNLHLNADPTASETQLPAPYQAYQIDDLSLSPDGHLAVIIPKEVVALPDVPINYLVTRDPFVVLCKLPTTAEFPDPLRSGGLVVNWAKDSSAAVIYVPLKWSPDKVYVVSLPKGHSPQVTDLDSEIRKLLQPDFAKAKVSGFNDNFDYVFDTDYEGAFCWKINATNRVVIDCLATTDPKNIPPAAHWTAHFQGLWDISSQRFISHQVTSKVSQDDDLI